MAGGDDQPRRRATKKIRSASDRGGKARAVRRFCLLSGDRERLYASKGGRTVIGTHPSSDLVLEDPTVSRFHCELAMEEERVVLRDLNSRNGTIVDGVSILACDLHDKAILTLGHTHMRFELGEDFVSEPLSDRERFGSMVGGSDAIRAAFALLERASGTDATLLLLGETGTGKDLAAEAVHEASSRRDGPLVVVDCGAIPSNLLESQLFGHVQGAFTGADRDRKGAFEQAEGGTLFLDEIGELALELQPKLLRVLETRQVQPVGSNRHIPVDVRIIAATNRDLRGRVNDKTFRSDLYYRLAVLEVVLPPLRDRKEDIPLLVEHLVAASGVEGVGMGAFHASDFHRELQRHEWPGNVRELRNYIERALVMGEPVPLPEERGLDESTPVSIDATRPLREERDRWILRVEKRYLEEILRLTNQNVSEAARRAGVDRAHFYRLLSKCGLR